MHLDKQHPVPVYLQLKEMLRSQIERGVYRLHQKLPSERTLCQDYDLSRMTARRALKELIDEGWVYTRAGKGTFVNYNPANNHQRQPEELELTKYALGKAELIQNLMTHLIAFNSLAVEQTISQALSAYPVETVAHRIFPVIIRQLEQKWQQEEITLSAQNFAITTLYSHLVGMVNAARTAPTGPKVLLACAPEDQHEIGLLLLTLSLRRRGFTVIYLGCNIAAYELHHVIEAARPQLIGFSAATVSSGEALIALNRLMQTNGQGREHPLFTFGGRAFSQNRALIARLQGTYLGDTIETAITKVQSLMEEKVKTKGE